MPTNAVHVTGSAVADPIARTTSSKVKKKDMPEYYYNGLLKAESCIEEPIFCIGGMVRGRSRWGSMKMEVCVLVSVFDRRQKYAYVRTYVGVWTYFQK
jgi:hypothetical protein